MPRAPFRAVALVAVAVLIGCGGTANSPEDQGSQDPGAPTALGSAPPAVATFGLCDGLVQDKLPHPMTPLEKPQLGQMQTDPEFGTRIRRITAASTAEGNNAIIKPMYSVMQAWNADESRLILWHREAGHELYDGRTYAFIRTLPLVSPTDIEQVLWDPDDPDLLYYPSNYTAVPNLMRYRVSTNANEVLANFQGAPTNCPVDWGQLLQLGRDPQYMSWGPAKVVGLQCGTTKFLYDIQNRQVMARSVKTFPVNNAPIVGPSGRLVYFEGGVYDQTLTLLRRLDMVNPGEHASMGRGQRGDTYDAVSFDDALTGTIVSHDLATGVKTVIVGPSTGWPYPKTGTHLSGNSHRTLGWIAASMVGNVSGQGVLDQEILLANTDTGEVCRVAHHRSWAGEGGRWGYWAEPHVVISPTATRMLFGSDWGNGPTVDTYVVELPRYKAGRTSAATLGESSNP
jgi:hypothetical protein